MSIRPCKIFFLFSVDSPKNVGYGFHFSNNLDGGYLPTLMYQNEKFIFACTFDERTIAKNAGLRWDDKSKVWYTNDLAVASRLRDYAIGVAKNKLKQSLITVSPWSGTLPPGLYDHQWRAITFALSRNRCYLGLDPGLGKTPVAAVIAETLKQPVVYISPPFLVRNVAEEFKRWAPTLKTSIYGGVSNQKVGAAYDVLIIPDSLLQRESTFTRIKRLSSQPSILIVDEAHRFKTPEAKRTQALFGTRTKPGIVDLFEKQIFMSGSPMPNRPIELYPVLSKIAPECIDYMSLFDYGNRYCAGYRDQYGWDFTGASNVAALAAKVIYPSGPFMLRMKKHLLQLPPKIEEVFVVSENMPPQLAKLDRKIAENPDIEDVIKHRLADAADLDGELMPIATYRRLLGIEKAKAVIEYIKSILAESDESILVFGYHRETIQILEHRLADAHPFVITGDTPSAKRQDLVNEFQTNKHRRLFIGNYLACGVGFTLTKATRILFVEFDWVPGTNTQAADRAHRIGQASSVLVQYVAYSGSIDHKVIETLLRKQRSIDHI